jgi:hypothetical protein
MKSGEMPQNAMKPNGLVHLIFLSKCKSNALSIFIKRGGKVKFLKCE